MFTPTYRRDSHRDVCLVTHLPMCLIFFHAHCFVDQCDIGAFRSFCTEVRPEAAKSSIITGFSFPFIRTALNLRALCTNRRCYRLQKWDHNELNVLVTHSFMLFQVQMSPEQRLVDFYVQNIWIHTK